MARAGGAEVQRLRADIASVGLQRTRAVVALEDPVGRAQTLDRTATQSVDGADNQADNDADEKGENDRCVRMASKCHADDVRRQPQHGPNGQINVASDDDHRLAHREQRNERRSRQELLDTGPTGALEQETALRCSLW